jgi:hypothetical protein
MYLDAFAGMYLDKVKSINMERESILKRVCSSPGAKILAPTSIYNPYHEELIYDIKILFIPFVSKRDFF